MSARPAAPLWAKALFAVVAFLGLGGPVVAEGAAWLFPDHVPIPASLGGVAMDAPAEDFELMNLQGQTVRLSDYRGKVVFLNFWATWCPPCVEELPSMTALHAEMNDEAFEILAVSEDDTREEVLRFFDGIPPPFPVVMDDGQRVTRAFGTFKFPETYVIDREGRLRAKFVGARQWDSPEAVAWFRRLSG